MVLRRGHPRHKNVPDPLEAAPKRVTTIHAQRKFAQGMISPAMSPIKEKEKRQSNGGNASNSSAAGSSNNSASLPSPSTSTAKRPRTVDFINYLTFRPFLGTTLLPQSLKNFSLTTKPQKNDGNSAPSSSPSKQASSPTRQEQDENKAKKVKQAKRAVMQSKSKVLDQRQRKTRLNAIVQKGASKVLKPRDRNPTIAKDHLKKVVAAARMSPNSQQFKKRPGVPVAKSSHPSILKRLGASRARAGLRSAGQPSTGTDTKTDRKAGSPQLARNKHQPASILRNKSSLRIHARMNSKQNNKRAASAIISPKQKRDRLLGKGNLGVKNSPPKNINLASRPSRKTKIAASLYMEMITKDLRSPDEDDDSYEKVPFADTGCKTPQNTRQRRSLGSNEIDSTPSSSKSVIKMGTRTSSSVAASITSPSNKSNVKPEAGSSKALGKKVKNLKKEDEATDSEEEEDTKTQRKRYPAVKKQVKKLGRKEQTVSNISASKPNATKESQPKKSGAAKNQKSVGNEDENSSQSEDDEDTNSRSQLKRVKAPQKMVLGKKGSLKPISKEAAKSVGKKVGKDAANQNASTKRSTRSGGTSIDSAPSSEVQYKTNSSAKTVEKKAQPSSPAKKLSRQSGVTAKDTAGAKKAVTKTQTSDESDSEDEDEPLKKSSSKSAQDSKAAEGASKKHLSKTGKGKKTASAQNDKKSTKKSLLVASSSEESESEIEKPSGKRVTRKSNQLTKDKGHEAESCDEETVISVKRGRKPVLSEVDSDSDSNKESPPKSKKQSKSSVVKSKKVISKTPVFDVSDEEEIETESKLEISAKSVSKKNDNKPSPRLKAAKKSLKVESGGESDKEVPAKRLKANPNKSSGPLVAKVLSKQDISSETDGRKQNKPIGKKSSIASPKTKEESLKKADKAGSVQPAFSEKAATETEVVSKRTTRISTPTILPTSTSLGCNSEMKPNETGPLKKLSTNSSKKGIVAPSKGDEKSNSSEEAGQVDSSKIKLTKAGKIPAKRGRKPKSLASATKIEDTKPRVDEPRPSRTRRRTTLIKKETYSEFSDDDDDDESDVALPRTRGRNSNVKYTENDSEDEEVSETEKRPRRSTRAVFCPTLGLDIDSDFDDFDDFATIPIKRSKPESEVLDIKENVVDGIENKPDIELLKTIQKTSNANQKTLSEDASKKSDNVLAKKVKEKNIKIEDGSASDTSTKRIKTLKNNQRNNSSLKQPENTKGSEKKTATPVNDPKTGPTIVPVHSVTQTCIDLNGADTVSQSSKKNYSLVTPDSSFIGSVEAKGDQTRISRRLSKDKAEKSDELGPILGVDKDGSTVDQSSSVMTGPKLGLGAKTADLLESTSKPSELVGENYVLNIPSKDHYEDGLATLADVAISELQSRKNIMERKLSSDSATSFSSDDVLLPVRRDKIIPKAKADLPTVREKTESDEEISDVGNEDTDDGSSFDEFRKSNKQFRRKRLPRRTRKETSRPQTRRPVRSVRLAADSYVDDNSSSSDRSSTPEVVQAKPALKKIKKPDESTLLKIPSNTAQQPGKVDVPHSQPAVPFTASTTPISTEGKKVKEVTQLVVKPARDDSKPVVSSKEDTLKTSKAGKTPSPLKATIQQSQVKLLAQKRVLQVEPVSAGPKSQLPLVSPKDGPTVDVRNNNSMTLFSGVSGVRIMKPTLSDNKAPLGKPVSVKIEAPRSYQSSQLHPASPKISNEKTIKSIAASQASFLPNNSTQPKDQSYHSFSDSSMLNTSVSDSKSKPNIGDTWKNAFINAKLPKPGQVSPAHHSSGGTPFIRKQFTNTSKTPKLEEPKPSPHPPTKLPGVQTFKTSAFPQLSKLGSQSPNRAHGAMSPSRQLVSGPSLESKGNIYLGPTRAKGSPAKAEEKVEMKKMENSPQKSLTLLQYEKRSQELISSLKDPQPVLLDGSKTYVQAYPTKLKEYSMEKARSQAKAATAAPSSSTSAEETSKTEGGKHLNLPFAVEQAFRKRSPITVKKPVKQQVEKKTGPSITIPESASPATQTPTVPRIQQVPTPIASTSSSRVDMLSKKKVNMTEEEIKKWLEDDDSPKVHSKDCGLFENNQCKCSYRTSSESMQNTSILVTEVIKKEEHKVDHGVVEPPVQLRELDSGSKFTAETISTCKVDDYKEKMFSKAPTASTPEVKKELVPPNVPKPKKPSVTALSVDKNKRKSSMTEDEMCEFDFRFERTSNSPRESGSDMSSPTPRDDVSSSNDEKLDSMAQERKSIFLPRRPGVLPVTPKRSQLSKSPCAFSAENESSVYAFDDAPLPTVSNPFRRRGSRNRSSEDDGPIASSSIAVQVNLENSPAAASSALESGEQVLETSTQTDQNEGQLFYFPLGGDKNPQEVIQGVQVNLQNLQSTEGPEQSVIMKAKLVTKPSMTVNSPSSGSTVRPLGENVRMTQRPEQKVRPLASCSDSTAAKPPVVSVQPTIRDPPPSSPVTFNSQGTATATDGPALATRSTQAASLPPTSATTQTSTVPAQSTSAQEAQISPVEEPVPVPPAKPPTKSTPRRSSPNEFPHPGTTPRMVDAPTFYPTEKEFQDPLDYFDQILPQAQSFGICRIVPPASFKPECKVSDDMRFTAYNQYVHKMLYRWGPNVREMTAIKKYLATQSIAFKQPPYIGGMEIDLPRLYQTVQSWGGLKEVIEKKRWAKVADTMKIPKAAQDRVTKLDDIYCKFLLPYDTLSHSERSKLLEEVDAEWTERERRIALEAERESRGEKEEKEENSDSDEESDDGRDECITKGRTMPLSGFYRIARNTMAMWFKEPSPSAKEVENEYWKQVTSRKQHVCVNSGSIDSGSLGYGFPTSKSSSTARHPWNLKVLTNNSGSILRSLGPLMGVTVPTLHVGMLFSACCWYRDPHGLPWIEYAHTGANKIWYAVPDLWNEELHGAMRTILPRYCQDKPIWLASDTAMVPPDLLVQQGVSLCRAVQEPGQFILVFPKAFTSTICTGYIVSESVYFAQSTWLESALQTFKDIKESCEQPAFSLERLIFSIATDQRSSAEVLSQILPMIIELKDTELQLRKELAELGVTESERLAISRGRKKSQEDLQEYECEICRGNLYLSLVTNSVEEANFCLDHSVETLTKDRSHIKNCKLMYSYDEEEMDEVIEKVKLRIETKSCKKLKGAASCSKS